MTEVQIENDGKKKHQSFTARWEDSTVGGMGFRSVELTGYGSTEAEARGHLVEQARAMRDQLNSAVEVMIDELISPPRVPV